MMDTKNILAAELCAIELVRPNPHNSRVHSEDQIAKLMSSLTEFGQMGAILTDEYLTILAGHAVYEAARRLGWTEVLVRRILHLTDIKKRTFLIADNQLGLISDWNGPQLAQELAVLERELVKLDVIGFAPEELDRLLSDLAPEHLLVDEDAVPAVPARAITVCGDVWIMGNHRLTCGDSRLPETLDRVLAGGFADATFTDFPYGVHYKQRAGNRAGLAEIANDNLGAQFEEFLYEACVQVLRVTRGAVYLCMSSSELHTLYKAFTAAGGHWSTFIIWWKDHFTLGRSNYQRQYEPILYGWPGGQEHYWCGTRNQGDVWQIPKPKASPLHPTMKPVALVERAIRNSCRRGGVILDPFAGAGATLIACEKAGRHARLVELEPRFVDVMVQRWEAYTGQEAHRESDGQSFTAVAQEKRQHAA